MYKYDIDIVGPLTEEVSNKGPMGYLGGIQITKKMLTWGTFL